MNIFDGAKNMTLPATWTQEERDEFRIIDVTQIQMDELSGSVDKLCLAHQLEALRK